MDAKIDLLTVRTKALEDKMDQLMTWSRSVSANTGLAATASRKGYQLFLVLIFFFNVDCKKIS